MKTKRFLNHTHQTPLKSIAKTHFKAHHKQKSIKLIGNEVYTIILSRDSQYGSKHDKIQCLGITAFEILISKFGVLGNENN